MDKAMRMALPGTVPSVRWQGSSATPLSVLWKNEGRHAGPRGATPAKVAAPVSLQRINLLFFLRSITKSLRHK